MPPPPPDRFFGSHELRSDAEETIKTSSDRNFGFVFACFFSFLGVMSLFAGHTRWPLWFGLGLIFLLTTFLKPHWLAPLNKLWSKLGLLIYSVLYPIIIGIIFYVIITPVGVLMRLTGNDPLRLKFDGNAKSYWIPRDPPGPAPDTLKNQF